MPTIQYSVESDPLSAQAVYFLHSTMPSVTCLQLSGVSAIYRATYFQFPIQSALLPCRSATTRQHLGVLGLPNIGHRTLPKISVRFLYAAYIPGNDLELILTVKMETRHPVQGLFISEFPAICNHCVVMAAWSRTHVEILWEMFAFLRKKNPLR